MESAANRGEGVPASRSFVGREKELATARRAIEDARGGRGAVLLIAGAPGIGKTCIAQRVADLASASGMSVLWGRCPEDRSVPPFWPWRQLLRAGLNRHQGDALRAVIGGAAPHLAALDPQLVSDGVPVVTPAVAADQGQDRFALFDAITGVWHRAAAIEPILLVLDDLHCADIPSLRLLEFMLRESTNTALMVVGTYRDAEVTREHPLQSTVAALMRQLNAERLKLTGFTLSESEQFVQTIGSCQEPAWVSALHERTEGHPLFLAELARLLSDRPERTLANLPRVPEGVRDVIDSRLNRLSPLCNHLLGNASVIGQRFGTESLIALLDEVSPDEAIVALDEACRASLIERDAELDAWQFTHTLVRDALYIDMPMPRRTRLHLKLAEHLEQRSRLDEPGRSSVLAHHYQAARDRAPPGKASEHAVRAARHAAAAFAHEEAARLYAIALETLDTDRDAERCDLLLDLGEARLASGQQGAAIEHFNAAAELARGLPAPQALARAALGHEIASWRTSGIGVVSVLLLREALVANPPLDSVMRSRLLSALCRALIYADRVDAAVAIHGQTVAMARRLGDGPALFFALSAIMSARWSPELRPTRLLAGREALALGERLGRTDWTIGHLTGWLIGDLLEDGDVEAATHVANLGDTQSALLRHDRWALAVQTTCRAMIALHKGHFAEAERLITQCLDLGFNGAAAVQMFTLRRLQGRLAELAPVLDRFREGATDATTWQPGFIVLCCEIGRTAEATDAFHRMAALDFTLGNVNHGMRPGSLVYLAEACAMLGEADHAERLRDLLMPYAGGGILFGANVASFGSVDRVLGMLCATMEQWDAAEAHFAQALVFDKRSGGRPWLAHTHLEYANMLRARGRAGDQERARPMLEAALAIATELDMGCLAARAQQGLVSEDAAATNLPAGLSAREAQVLRLVASGATNQEIAEALSRSVNTVANHVRNILGKIGAANRTEAAAFAARHHLLDL